MNTEDKLKEIFAEVFAVSKNDITLQTKQSDLENWDSLGQLRLIMAIEDKMNISFAIDEIAKLDNFEQILERINE